jgi:hypothetical protein
VTIHRSGERMPIAKDAVAATTPPSRQTGDAGAARVETRKGSFAAPWRADGESFAARRPAASRGSTPR